MWTNAFSENEEGFVKDPIVMKRDPLYSCSKEIKNDFVLDWISIRSEMTVVFDDDGDIYSVLQFFS